MTDRFLLLVFLVCVCAAYVGGRTNLAPLGRLRCRGSGPTNNARWKGRLLIGWREHRPRASFFVWKATARPRPANEPGRTFAVFLLAIWRIAKKGGRRGDFREALRVLALLQHGCCRLAQLPYGALFPSLVICRRPLNFPAVLLLLLLLLLGGAECGGDVARSSIFCCFTFSADFRSRGLSC